MFAVGLLSIARRVFGVLVHLQNGQVRTYRGHRVTEQVIREKKLVNFVPPRYSVTDMA